MTIPVGPVSGQTRSRCSAGCSPRGCPPECRVWLSFGLRSRRAPCRGVAPEGTAQLAVAMPASPSLPVRARRGEASWRRCSSGSIPTSCRRRSRSSTITRRCWRRAGSAPTRPATPRCASTSRPGRSGSGRSRAATAPAGRWRSGCCRRRARGRRAGEAVGPGAVVRHRPQPQDRRPRRARGRGGRGPHQGAAGAVLRRRARGAADAGRPPRGADPAAGADRQPAAAAAVRTAPWPGEEGHDRPAGQGDPRLGAAPRPGRQDPPAARRRAAGRAGRGREEDQGVDQGAEGDGAGPRLDG